MSNNEIRKLSSYNYIYDHMRKNIDNRLDSIEGIIKIMPRTKLGHTIKSILKKVQTLSHFDYVMNAFSEGSVGKNVFLMLLLNKIHEIQKVYNENYDEEEGDIWITVPDSFEMLEDFIERELIEMIWWFYYIEKK